jgi:uncharacterized protein
MTRSEMLLAILAASGGSPYTPVQIQKAAFLVTRNLPNLVNEGPVYEFTPYDYGPFDQNVYADAEIMQHEGRVEIIRQEGARWNRYAASDLGVHHGQQILNVLRERERNYIVSLSRWIRAQTFEQLVKAIYAQYPEMRTNSIFRG